MWYDLMHCSEIHLDPEEGRIEPRMITDIIENCSSTPAVLGQVRLIALKGFHLNRPLPLRELLQLVFREENRINAMPDQELLRLDHGRLTFAVKALSGVLQIHGTKLPYTGAQIAFVIPFSLDQVDGNGHRC